MGIRGLIFLLSIFQAVCVFSQSVYNNPGKNDAYSRITESDSQFQISVYTDSLLVENYYKHLLQNMKLTGIPGYRIRIFSESGLGAKEEQKKVRARFLSLYPGVDAYYMYDGLNFKVYVGDCRTKSEATILYDRIRRSFPGAIIVRDNINIVSIDKQIKNNE